MSTLKSIIFETLPDDAADEYRETTEALKDLDRQYRHFASTVWKASKQLLKFDEINRLVAAEVEEKAASVKSSGSGRASSSRSSSTKTTAGSAKKAGAETDTDPHQYDAQLPLHFTIKDVLFNWDDLNWEQIMMKLLAGFTALGGEGGGNVGMPITVTYGGTRSTGTATRDSSTGVVTFTAS